MMCYCQSFSEFVSWVDKQNKSQETSMKRYEEESKKIYKMIVNIKDPATAYEYWCNVFDPECAELPQKIAYEILYVPCVPVH